ncbi:MAG: lamin tail domain-containing protein [Flavobacteriaceae bacterium]|nr:MAG: lamin tail domain-containing protein [Flavobacteriaceae bacterium]
MKIIRQCNPSIVFKYCCLLFIFSCVKDPEFKVPETSCNDQLITNSTFNEVKDLVIDDIIQIQQDLIIAGYVISSDQEGNFFSTIHVQDDAIKPTSGFQVEIDLRDSYLFYEAGSKVYIRLKGLYLGKSKGVYKLGGVFTSFGKLSVGRLPALAVKDHLILSCEPVSKLVPSVTTIPQLNEELVSTLVRFESMEIIAEEQNMTFAFPKEETIRNLMNCNGDMIELLNSGYSDFQDKILPSGNGSVTAVLYRENDDYQLIIRGLNDLNLTSERCIDAEVFLTSDQVFISELADPNNNAEARFIELYNAGNDPLLLNGWVLVRYTNENDTASSEIDLSGIIIESNSTLVFSPNAMEFESVYGFLPDFETGNNSPADSNGDDNLVLIDPFGAVIDIFGLIGEDGSGTNHEFEDGKAERNSNISQGNSVFTSSEWTIYNDTGGLETLNLPQNAPEDFSPGIR